MMDKHIDLIDEVNFKQTSWYQFIIESLPVGIISVDSNLRITHINAYAINMTGWSFSKAKGHFCGEVLRGSNCGKECPLRSVLSQEKTMINLRSTMTNKDGQVIPIRLRTVGLYNKQGNLLGAVEAFADISDVVALEKEREQTLSFFAHDMKSPLMSASVILDRLNAGKAGALKGKQKVYIDMLQDDLVRVQSLVMDFLDVVRLHGEHTKLITAPWGIDKNLKQIVPAYRVLAEEKGLGFKVQIANGLPVLEVDGQRLTRAIGNLLDNAIKYSEKGTVELKAEQATDGWIQISICDRGPGLSQEDLKSLFKPFYRGSAASGTEGTGLGLAAVKVIAEVHGGRIESLARKNGGVCFKITLPSPNPADGQSLVEIE